MFFNGSLHLDTELQTLYSYFTIYSLTLDIGC